MARIPITQSGEVPHYAENQDFFPRMIEELEGPLLHPNNLKFESEAQWRVYADARLKDLRSRRIEFVDAFEFEASAKFIAFNRGRSAAYAKISLDHERIKQACMFLSNLQELLLGTKIVQGAFDGRFTIVKKGANFGLRWLGPRVALTKGPCQCGVCQECNWARRHEL